MASTGGLTRRRAGGGASTGDDDDSSIRVDSPSSRAGLSNDRTPETLYTGGENGHKIAFDPRDISESEERNKQPKLTLMEEVLLMGLKDKQVSYGSLPDDYSTELGTTGLPVVLERQHPLRSTRLHRDRAGFPRSREHAERLLKTEVSPGRSGH